ncbi:MAG: alpha/beta hydrolase [Pseudomonadota bacterium]
MPSFVTSDGLNLYYEESGEGLPLLCLAGLTRTTRDFDYVAPYLDGVRLIRMDYRGRGQSDWDPDWINYNLPVECRDVLELLAHLGLTQVAILGTSRGGLNAMGLASVAPDALLGVALNDIGPVIETEGIDFIMGYLGRNPSATSYEDIARATAKTMRGFDDVSHERWLEEAHKHYTATPDGMHITYDPKLRDAVQAAGHQVTPDLWPYFDAVPDCPIALIWGENSDLLKETTVREMQKRRPELILAKVPNRGHIPFLDEPESRVALNTWLDALR